MKKFILFALLALLLPSSAWSYDVGEVFTANIGTEESPYFMRFKRIETYDGDVPKCVVYGEEGNPAIAKESAGPQNNGYFYIPSSIEGMRVVGISSYAFAECQNIKSVSISYYFDNIRKIWYDISFSIGDYAFYNCSQLQSFSATSEIGYSEYFEYDYENQDYYYYLYDMFHNVPVSVGDYAFYNCSSLRNLTVTSIGKEALVGTGITSVTFTGIGDNIDFGRAFCYIGDNAFSSEDEEHDSKRPIEIHFDASVTNFQVTKNAFAGCEITFVSVDGNNSFFYNSNGDYEKNVIINGNNSWDWDRTIVLGCSGAFIPDDINNLVIGANAFPCHVDKMVIPENVKTFYVDAFVDCDTLYIEGLPDVIPSEDNRNDELRYGEVHLPVQLYGNFGSSKTILPFLKSDKSCFTFSLPFIERKGYSSGEEYGFWVPEGIKAYIPIYENGGIVLKNVDPIISGKGVILINENEPLDSYIDVDVFRPDSYNSYQEIYEGDLLSSYHIEEDGFGHYYIPYSSGNNYILSDYNSENKEVQFIKANDNVKLGMYECYLRIPSDIGLPNIIQGIIDGGSAKSLTIDVTDENTYSSAEAPNVVNATVIIYEKDSMNEILRGNTGDNGSFLVENLPTGDYIIHVEAKNHRSRDYEYHRNGNEDEYVEIFLSLNKYLIVDVTDEFTYYTDEAPHVENATVVVYEKDSKKEIQRGTTGKDGTVSFEDLPVGDYLILVEADEHESKDYEYHRAADEDETVEITISYTGGVTCEFIVEETSVPDLYHLSVNYTCEVDIPLPFVYLSVPKSINVDDMAVGESVEFQARLYNNGWIRVNDVALLLPDDIPFMSFVPQQAYQGLSIEAKQSVTITVKATKTAAGDCKDALWGAAWSYPVGESTAYKNYHDILMAMGDCPKNIEEVNAIVSGSNESKGSFKDAKKETSYQAQDGTKTPNISPDKPFITVQVDVAINQALSLERQAFRGTMTMKNTYSASMDAIKDIQFNMDIIDPETGESVTSKEFEVQFEKLSGFSGEQTINGPWSLASGKQGTVSVLMIPTKYAAPTKTKKYKVVGSISYIDPLLSLSNPDESRKEENLIPKTIPVNPTPQLVLDYFIPKTIVGDDPMTEDEVEASEAAELALLIRNEGYGDAKNLKITTKQPEIVDNRDGLLIDFAITGGTVNGKPVGMTEDKELVSDFGTLKARSAAYAQWWLTSTLLGRITKYDVSYLHETGYDNENLSLLNAVNAHSLVRSIKKENSLFGFLTDNEETSEYHFYGADGSVEGVQRVDDIDVTKKNQNSYIVGFVATESGYIYGYIQDPSDGKGKLKGGNLIDYWRESVRFSDEAPARWMKAPAMHEKTIHFVCRVPKANQAYELTLDLDNPDNISSVVISTEKDEWFTLSGLRVSKPNAKGVYIHNGRKVLVK